VSNDSRKANQKAGAATEAETCKLPPMNQADSKE